MARAKVVHVDAYRLSGSDDLDSIGWERIIDGSAIVFVEWPERIAEAMQELQRGRRMELDRLPRLRMDAREPEAPRAFIEPRRLEFPREASSEQSVRIDKLEERLDRLESRLDRIIEMLEHTIVPNLRKGNYQIGLEGLADLRGPVDRFFDEILVMASDPKLRVNRIALLRRLRGLFQHTADFSLIQAQEDGDG